VGTLPAKIFGILAIIGGISTILFAVVLLRKIITEIKKPAPYYPNSSFQIPADVLKDRVATEAAQTVRIPMIMYHYIEYVDKDKDPARANLATPPSYLEKDISSLKSAGYTFLFAKDVPDLINKKNVIQNPVVLTFDDGYEDFYWNALPILKKYNVKATLYVITNFVGRRGNPSYLTAEELIEIRDSGLVEIGAHTLDHAYLRGLKADTARNEIIESKAYLENLLGISVPSFAYPFGAFNKETIDIVKAAGFTNAVSVIPGINQSTDNLFYLYRIRPGVLSYNDPAKSLADYKQDPKTALYEDDSIIQDIFHPRK